VIRQTIFGLLTMTLIACGLAVADDPPLDQNEPPVRLKKKVKPQPEPDAAKKSEQPKKAEPPKKVEPPGKPREGKEDADREAADMEQKLKEITNRLSKNLETAEQKLKENDPSDPTQQVQRDIVKDLDDLIEQMKRQQQQQQQSSSSSQQRNQQARKNKMRQNQASNQQPQPNQDNQDQNQQGKNARGGNSREQQMSKIADLYKDIWGHLPETLRQEMNQYAREQFMPKYNELLKQYYATIAEKGRQKSEK
jgi:hypothetical protein